MQPLSPGATRPAELAVLNAAVAFGRALRHSGFGASVDRELLFCQALCEVDVRVRDDVYWAARAAFVQEPAQLPLFEAAFERFWGGHSLDVWERGSEHGESDPRMAGPQHGGESLPQARREGQASPLLDAQKQRSSAEIPSGSSDDDRSEGEKKGVLAAYSPADTEGERKRLEYRHDELAAVRRLIDDLKRTVPERRSRRLRPDRVGHRLDVRKTLRGALATEGEAFRLSYSAPSVRPRRLLFLCDVSGSMDRYSRVLLASLKAAVGASGKTEAFVFATRLTRLTRSLSGRDLERTLEQARAAVADWSGGTRIGHVLAEFNRTYARRGFARGAIVIVVSDGWDRGDPDVLARELRRLQLQARRLVWINPRPLAVNNQPLAIGMRAALPYVDDFVPGHDPRAVAGIARVLSGLGARRPQRRRTPVPGVASPADPMATL